MATMSSCARCWRCTIRHHISWCATEIMSLLLAHQADISLKTPISLSHSASDEVHIHDTPSQPQLDLQPATLRRISVINCISTLAPANIPSSSDRYSLIAHCKQIGKEEEKELTTLLNNFQKRFSER